MIETAYLQPARDLHTQVGMASLEFSRSYWPCDRNRQATSGLVRMSEVRSARRSRGSMRLPPTKLLGGPGLRNEVPDLRSPPTRVMASHSMAIVVLYRYGGGASGSAGTAWYGGCSARRAARVPAAGRDRRPRRSPAGRSGRRAVRRRGAPSP